MKIVGILFCIMGLLVMVADYVETKKFNEPRRREKWRYDLLAVAHLEPEAEEAVEELLHELGIKVMEV